MKRKYLTMMFIAAAVLTLTACTSLKKEETETVIQTTHLETAPAEAEPDGEIIPDEDAAAAENDISGANDTDESNDWTGTYVGDEETVTIALLDEATISFAFAQSGISGTASVNDMQAVYKGDDHYVVVFNRNGTVVDVSVSNEEDYDASESPLNGTYIKE